MQLFHLHLQVLRLSIIDHHIIGQRQPLRAAGLGSNHPVGQCGVDAVTLHQPGVLHGFGRIHQQHPVQPWVGLPPAHLGQQRNGRNRIGAGGLLALLLHQQADSRVGDRFQRRPLGRVGEHVSAQAGPVKAAVGQQHVGAEALGNAGQGGLPAATTARAARSASATTIPSASKRRVTSLLPEAMPPVRPTT